VPNWTKKGCEHQAEQQNHRHYQKSRLIPGKPVADAHGQHCHMISEVEVKDICTQRGVSPPSKVKGHIGHSQHEEGGLKDVDPDLEPSPGHTRPFSRTLFG